MKVNFQPCCSYNRKDQSLNSTSVQSHCFCVERPSSDASVGLKGSWNERAAIHRNWALHALPSNSGFICEMFLDFETFLCLFLPQFIAPDSSFLV